MVFIEFEKSLKQRAQLLSYQDRISHGISICKRLFPYYKEFVNESSFGNPDVLLDSIRFVETGKQDSDQLHEFLESLEEVCPDTEDYDGGEFALNACGAVNALLLQVAEPNDEEHYIEIAMSYYDTIDAKVHDENEEELSEEEIENHPLLIEARHFLLNF
ncbi:DUF416 family protein [Flavisolibacter tropicus]|uniref:DUF416 domain-containing protein n=1 Tax=Flavisolibacter tropicus TaxID=1492898 RepID=A0A172TRQ1_9BACT|nr:DUF416 family protein [Flavisolibacter tropicus]ANE49443.1 hypothetical protein SY85_01945 [Flavisolibacter tropicus]